ncbi:MAG TPA: limonene-1,2-epoxide hydrolase family protein [Bryobacteraceae bacterium]|nr:limonene-1,2-epoxide hydrolase family protein [Bryobacteraceae bacterium]
MEQDASLTRGRFLRWAGASMGVATAVGLPRLAEAAEPSAAEKANLKVVADFCASFAGRDMAKIAAFLADDCVYRIVETAPPARGKKDSVERIRSYVERSTKIELKILQSWANGPIVMNERIDSFEPAIPGSPFHLTGVFFVRDGKIAEWTDYLIRP